MAARRTEAGRKDHEAISMDDGYMSREHNQLLNSHREIDDMLSQGAEVMNSLRSQRETLKGARKTILDIGNSLGMSNTVMQFIEKRTANDQIILYLGMTLFILFMLLVWWYFL